MYHVTENMLKSTITTVYILVGERTRDFPYKWPIRVAYSSCPSPSNTLYCDHQMYYIAVLGQPNSYGHVPSIAGTVVCTNMGLIKVSKYSVFLVPHPLWWSGSSVLQ